MLLEMSHSRECGIIILALLVIIACGTQSALAAATPATPVFADNYRVRGVLSLPYAELNEPFTAYYDKAAKGSRTDYYGGDYSIYQFAPGHNSSTSDYGAMYKFIYVPQSFHAAAATTTTATPSSQPKRSNRAKLVLSEAYKRISDAFHHEHEPLASDGPDGVGHAQSSKTRVKRVCFATGGSVGFTIAPQSVLPDLSDFKFDAREKCPYVAGSAHRHATCELWKLVTTVGDKKNTYKFWLRRDPTDERIVIPVHYFMLGYDRLLGSHYDRYDISYYDFKVNGVNDADFAPVDHSQCGPFPGPGDTSDVAEQRAHLVISNPIHEFVSEPMRYDHVDHHFEQFQLDHERKYSSEQHVRESWFNFLHNLRFILGKNRELKDYKLGLNKFADVNVSDLRYLRGKLHSKGYNGGLDYARHHNLQAGGSELASLPESFDWNSRGAVTPVKDQAVCGSCWSFGTSGSVEGAYFVKTGKLLRLSQQQLIDCSWQYGNNGCDGGEDFRAYKYIQDNGGLSTEEDYGHYLGIDGKCHDHDVERSVKIKGFYNVTANNVDALKHALVTYGPISISIDASPQTFAFYSHGAYYDPKCKNDPEQLDHSVLAVGYQTLNGKLVWKIKNSWSTYWGNDGYIYISAENNNCGVLDAPTVPIIEA